MSGLHFSSSIDKGFDKDLLRMERSLAKLDTKVKSSTGIMNSSFASVAKSIGGVVSVMAIGQAGKELLNFSKELETALIEVATISNDVAGNMEEYKNSLLGISIQEDLAASSAKELAEAYYDVVSAGYDGAEGLQVLEASARAGTAGFVEVATAADGITTVLNAWGKTASEAGNVSDIFFKTVEKGKTTFPELGANINQVAPLAASLGVSFEEVTAAVATITKQGVPTSQAFTQIRSALVGMNESLGDGWAETMTLQEAMQSIYDTAGGSATEIQALVGRVEGMSAILATSGKNALGAAADLEAMNTALGATSTAAERVTQTTEYKVKLMKNSILAALEPLGTEFNKTFGEIAKMISDGFESGDIQAFASAITSLIKVFVAYKASVIAMNQVNKIRKAILLKNIALQEKMRLEYALSGKTASKSALKMAVANKTLASSFKSLTAAFRANPLGFLVTGLLLATEAMDFFGDSTGELTKETLDSTESLLDYNKTQKEGIESTKRLYDRYIELAKKTNLTAGEIDELKKIEGEIQKDRPDLIKSTDDFTKNLDSLTLASNTAATSLANLGTEQKALIKSQAYLLKQQAEDAKLEALRNIESTSSNVLNTTKKNETSELLKTEQGRSDVQKLFISNSKELIEWQKKLEYARNAVRNAGDDASESQTKYVEKLEIEVARVQDNLNLYKEYIPLINELAKAEADIAKANERIEKLDNKDKKTQAEIDAELAKKAALEAERLLELSKSKKQLSLDEKKEYVKLLQQQKAYELEKLLSVGASKEEIFNKTQEEDKKIFDAQVAAQDKTLLEQKTFLIEQKRLYDEFYADLAKSRELVDNESAIGKTGEDQIFKVRGSGSGKGTVFVPKNTTETDDSTAESFDKVTDSAKILSEVFRSMETDLGDVLANLTVSVAQLYDGFDKDGSTAGKISGIISLVTVLGTEINKKVVENYDKAAISIGKVSKEQASLLSMQYAYNNLLKERNELELNASAFYDAAYTDEYQNALSNSLTAQATYNKSMAALQGNLVVTAEGTGKSLLGVSEKSREYSFTMQQLAEQDSGYDSVFRQKTREAYQFQADPLDLFGGVANEKAYIDAYNNASKGVNVALESMGKTSADMSNFSQEQWSDFYILLDEGGYIVDEGTKNLISTMRTAQEEYQSSLEQMKDVIKDVAGELGNDLSDSLISAMQNGTDAMLEFEDGFNDVLIRMAQASAQQMFFQGLFDTLQQEMADSFDAGSANYDMNWQDDLLRFRSNLPDAIKGAQEFFNAVDSELQSIGLQGITGESPIDTSSNTVVGAIRQEITEQTGSELVGRAGAIMLSNEEIRTNSYQMLEYATQNLVLMNKIVTNTDYLPEIAANTKKTAEALR